jgi:hypothetical protein
LAPRISNAMNAVMSQASLTTGDSRDVAAVYLPEHVHFCRRGDCFVFLDLRNDDYILLADRSAHALASLIGGLLNTATDTPTGVPLELVELVETGLLTTDPIVGRAVAPAKVALALEPLLDPESDAGEQITAGHVWNFLCACASAHLLLRFRSIESTVRHVRQRRAPECAVDVERARQLVSTFNKLRFLFPRNYLCLYDSLALLEFLASYQIFPTWVFGIRLEPWAAHCWVQTDRFVFNEGVEEAAGHTPIMAI